MTIDSGLRIIFCYQVEFNVYLYNVIATRGVLAVGSQKCTKEFSHTKRDINISLTCIDCQHPTCQCGVKYEGSVPAPMTTASGGA